MPSSCARANADRSGSRFFASHHPPAGDDVPAVKVDQVPLGQAAQPRIER
jgi:hypothetical protein